MDTDDEPHQQGKHGVPQLTLGRVNRTQVENVLRCENVHTTSCLRISCHMENIYKCYSCEVLLPEKKMEGRGANWKCKDVRGCAKRRRALITLVVTEEPYRGYRDNYTRRGSRGN